MLVEAEDADDGEIDDDDGDLLEGDFFARGGSCFCGGALRLLELATATGATAMASMLTVLLLRLLKRPRPPPLLPGGEGIVSN